MTWVNLCDIDGVVVVPADLIEQTLGLAEGKKRMEGSERRADVTTEQSLTSTGATVRVARAGLASRTR